MKKGSKREKLTVLGLWLAPVGALALVIGLTAGGLTHMPEISDTISAGGALMLIFGTALLAVSNRRRRKTASMSQNQNQDPS